MTVAFAAALLPEASVHWMANVYVRPLPEPSLSARSLADRLPVICASDEEMDSLLVIPVILHTGLGSQLSDTETDTVTGIIFLFGGRECLATRK